MRAVPAQAVTSRSRVAAESEARVGRLGEVVSFQIASG
jgi:hypothetical protein